LVVGPIVVQRGDGVNCHKGDNRVRVGWFSYVVQVFAEGVGSDCLDGLRRPSFIFILSLAGGAAGFGFFLRDVAEQDVAQGNQTF
jgi:hypothetical protein